MFHFTILSVGKIKNPSISSLVLDYQNRLNRYGHLERIIFSDGKTGVENQKIFKFLDEKRHFNKIILSEEGENLSSTELSSFIKDFSGKKILFVIGGAYGLNDEVKAKADRVLSLSKMTFTHEIAQLLLYEQLYRATSIINGSKYHH